MTSTQQVSTAEALWRGFTMRCPNCGTGRLFGRFLKVVDHCSVCGAAGRMLVEASALALAARLAHSYAEPASVRPQRARSHRLDEIRLRRVLDYIAQHLDEHITVAQLAGVACLSPSHFARMFKAAVGMAPHRYVSHQRLEIAMVLLAAGQRSLSDIALSCQFSSQASFNRAFRRATGVTPGEYRRARR
jgi:AraC family transcriptional regulator